MLRAHVVYVNVIRYFAVCLSVCVLCVCHDKVRHDKLSIKLYVP